jgi:hypothetical protein
MPRNCCQSSYSVSAQLVWTKKTVSIRDTVFYHEAPTNTFTRPAGRLPHVATPRHTPPPFRSRSPTGGGQSALTQPIPPATGWSTRHPHANPESPSCSSPWPGCTGSPGLALSLARAPGSQRGMPQVPPVLQELAVDAARLPNPPSDLPVPKTDQPFLTWLPPHSGHLGSAWAVIDRTNFSKCEPHSWHVYS